MFQSTGHWNQLVVQLGRTTLCRAQRTLLILTFVVFGAGIHVVLAVPQHGIDDASQLVGCGGDGLGCLCSQIGFLPAQEGAQGTVGTMQRVDQPARRL